MPAFIVPATSTGWNAVDGNPFAHIIVASVDPHALVDETYQSIAQLTAQLTAGPKAQVLQAPSRINPQFCGISDYCGLLEHTDQDNIKGKDAGIFDGSGYIKSYFEEGLKSGHDQDAHISFASHDNYKEYLSFRAELLKPIDLDSSVGFGNARLFTPAYEKLAAPRFRAPSEIDRQVCGISDYRGWLKRTDLDKNKGKDEGIFDSSEYIKSYLEVLKTVHYKDAQAVFTSHEKFKEDLGPSAEFLKSIDQELSVGSGDARLFNPAYEELAEYAKATLSRYFKSVGKAITRLDPGDVHGSVLSSFIESAAYHENREYDLNHTVNLFRYDATPLGKEYVIYLATVAPLVGSYLEKPGVHSAKPCQNEAAWPGIADKVEIGHMPMGLAY